MSENVENQEFLNTEDDQSAPGRDDEVTEAGNSAEEDKRESSFTGDEDDNDTSANTEDDTFPRSYVEELREENAKYRQRAQRADDLAQRLHTALTAATGRLHDASDLDFAQEHLDDPEALTAALDDLLAKKPHLASRRPSGDVGQGASKAHDSIDLAGLLRSRA